MAAVLTYQTTAQDSSDLTTYSFAAQAIGTATADRLVFVGVFGSNIVGGAAATIASGTVGGIATSTVIQAGTGALGAPVVGILMAAVPTGATATITVTFSGALARASIGVWSCTGMGRPAAYSTGSSTASPASVNLNTLPDGFAIGMIGQNDGSSYAWTNLTERFDTTVEGAGYSGSDSNGTTTGGTLAVSCTYSVANTLRAMVAASWGNIPLSFGTIIG